MEVDDIISYHDLVTAEKAALRKGMNFGNLIYRKPLMMDE